MPGDASGIQAYGEQRGAAIGDFDNDGRVDLALSQNGARTLLYHNASAKPGLRVHLEGSLANPACYGAVLRLQFDDHQGPVRELHAGSGYRSQDSGTLVLAGIAAALAAIILLVYLNRYRQSLNESSSAATVLVAQRV